MAHFAQVDENNTVVRVLVIPDEQEHRGNEYLNELGLTGNWIQTSFNHRIRGKFAGSGDIYDSINDVFIEGPQNIVTPESVILPLEQEPTND